MLSFLKNEGGIYMNICLEAVEGSNKFERNNFEDNSIKKMYIKKNIDIINEVMQFTTGYCGSFGTGYPFYALDKNFEGELPVIQEQLRYNEELKNISDKVSNEGKTPLIFAKDNHYIGTIAVADIIKEDSHKAVSELKKMGIHVVMLTGDNEKTAAIIGKEAGVDEVIAGVLPDGKENVVRELMKKGRTAMVGDGINDAPALTRADIGIAIGAGTDIAIDAADVVLMKSRLTDVAASIRLSKSTLRNIHENLFWAFFYNTIGIPLAAGAFVGLGLTLNPMFGAAAMSLSSFCVVTNALRLNLADIYGKRKKTE